MRAYLITLFFFPSLVFAFPSVDQQSAPPANSTQKIMNDFLNELTGLKEYFISEEKFVDPKNSSEISKRLKSFASLASQTKHDPTLRQENFKFSREILEKHIIETERVFRLGNKSYARWQLAATASICMSCHTQMPSESRALKDFENLKPFPSDFERAEFLFTTHAFDKSMDLYDKVIDGYPKNKISLDQVETALERQVAYYSRIKRDPQTALAKMNEHLKNPALTPPLTERIKSWNSQFQAWNQSKAFDPQRATEKQVLAFAKKNIETDWKVDMVSVGEPNLVRNLRTSGLLYEYLQNHPSAKSVPEILYWLAVSERTLNRNFFFSLSDLYLRECMSRYPASPIAKKCYDEYEAEMILGYTGSRGTELPDEVKAELLNFKNWVDSKGQVKVKGQN